MPVLNYSEVCHCLEQRVSGNSKGLKYPLCSAVVVACALVVSQEDLVGEYAASIWVWLLSR